MRGASRVSLAAAKERLTAVLMARPAAGGPEAGLPSAGTGIGDELFAVTGLLDRDPGLCRALSDPSRDAPARADLAQTLLSGKISDATLGQVTGLVSSRWSEPGDLADAAEQLAVLAVAAAADADGQLDELEDELFRFSRVVQANPPLRAALSNQFVPPERRRELALALVDGKVTATALKLITQAAAHSRGRSLDASLETYATLAAEQRERLVAEVHVAVPLTDEQRSRLVAALVAGYGHDVHLNVVLDPQVVGGISVRIGDELINGSVASRLADLRRRLAS
ncbi:MAG TPA: F0F1 ATP synthase subunit delta [Streptosporangiaceae bacterium]|nr:F0F1 ATP synthase subunit delta [Streptosporangiaceae bacterium]